jgi:hypothetical protein
MLIGLDGQRIIIYGGAIANSGNLTSEDSLYELNVINFEWRIPNISGKIPKSRSYHKANVIGKYMVITFGKYIFFWTFRLLFGLTYDFNKNIIN